MVKYYSPQHERRVQLLNRKTNRSLPVVLFSLGLALALGYVGNLDRQMSLLEQSNVPSLSTAYNAPSAMYTATASDFSEPSDIQPARGIWDYQKTAISNNLQGY